MVCEAIAPYGITNEVQRTDKEYLTYGVYAEALEGKWVMKPVPVTLFNFFAKNFN